jgi:hypothetical protein
MIGTIQRTGNIHSNTTYAFTASAVAYIVGPSRS